MFEAFVNKICFCHFIVFRQMFDPVENIRCQKSINMGKTSDEVITSTQNLNAVKYKITFHRSFRNLNFAQKTSLFIILILLTKKVVFEAIVWWHVLLIIIWRSGRNEKLINGTEHARGTISPHFKVVVEQLRYFSY